MKKFEKQVYRHTRADGSVTFTAGVETEEPWFFGLFTSKETHVVDIYIPCHFGENVPRIGTSISESSSWGHPFQTYEEANDAAYHAENEMRNSYLHNQILKSEKV